MNIQMPKPSCGTEICMIYKWNIVPGDEVNSGDNIAIILTPEGRLFDLQIFENGRIYNLLAKEGNMVRVGASIASLVTERGHFDGLIEV